MQAELLDQDFSDDIRKTKRVRVKKKMRVKLDSRKEKARKERKERIFMFILVIMVVAFLGALLMMQFGSGGAPEQIPYPE